MSLLTDDTVFAETPTWADNDGRWRVLVPASARNPRELARELIALQLADRGKRPGESWTNALSRALAYLDEPDRVCLILGHNENRLYARSGQVQYIEYINPRGAGLYGVL